MVWWRQDELERRLPYLGQRARVVKTLRNFFDGQGFTEVETPALQACPGLEPHLRVFRTALEDPFGGSRPMYLHTSPEFAMKKLLAGGMERIYQFARVWRNGERAALHHPEFTMLEWYRAHAGYERLMDDCDAILTGFGGLVSWRGLSCDLARPADRLTVQDAFREFAGIDLLATVDDPHEPSVAPMAEAARSAGLYVSDTDRWEDVVFRVLLDRIEPHLGRDRPTILMDYPTPMAALARRKPSDERVAERFELYAAGIELANAFGELTDAAEQRARFMADNALREKLYGDPLPLDEDFLSAVDAMPESAGIALGLDRLVLLLTGAEDITDVLWAPVG